MRVVNNLGQEQGVSAHRIVCRRQRYDEDLLRRIAIMLDLPDMSLSQGDPVPIGWHFPLIGCETPKADLRADGFAGLGVPMPALGLPRMLAAGRTARFGRPLRIGEELVRKSMIASIEEKNSISGPLAVVTTRHEICGTASADEQSPALWEEQNYVLLTSPYIDGMRASPPIDLPSRPIRTITPDETLLFHFSALSFNAHRIHLDRDYARKVEGYPDLVVNGGIVTLIMTEIARSDFGLTISEMRVRNKAPLFCNRPIRFLAERSDHGLRVTAHDPDGRLAAEMDAQINDQ